METRAEVVRRLRSRGYLPHSYGGGSTQFITFRLADSLPPRVLRRFQHEPHLARRIWQLEASLDEAHGACVLQRAECAEIVEDSLRSWLADRVHLLAWVVMPNHVHLVMTIPPRETLGSLMQSVKGFTARRINDVCGRTGRLWQREYFDRELIGDLQISNAIEYTLLNPVRAQLCAHPADWRFSSAWWAAREEG